MSILDKFLGKKSTQEGSKLSNFKTNIVAKEEIKPKALNDLLDAHHETKTDTIKKFARKQNEDLKEENNS